MSRLALALVLLLPLLLASCDSRPREINQEALKQFFAKHRVGSSPDYAIMKNGTDYLATVHGYIDDRSVCLQLIKPYNKNPALSVLPGAYTCVPLNE